MTWQLTESPHCLIHTSQLSRDWKMWDSAQSCTQKKCIVHIVVHTEWEEWISLPVTITSPPSFQLPKKEATLLILTSVHSPSRLLLHSLAHQLMELQERQTIYGFYSGLVNLGPQPLVFYTLSENGLWNNCCVLTDVNAYGKYCQEPPPKHCQHLSVNVFGSCLPTNVKN